MAIHNLVGHDSERGLLDTLHCACDLGLDDLKKKIENKIYGKCSQSSAILRIAVAILCKDVILKIFHISGIKRPINAIQKAFKSL